MKPASALCLLAGLLLSGCADYERRSDLVSIHAGEALAANRAIQTIDPWPRESFDPVLRSDGQRMEGAIRRYRNPETNGTTSTPVRPASAAISPQT